MIMKTIVILLLITIIYCLGSAAFFLIRDKGRSRNMAMALSWRIGLSLFLFFLLLIGYAMGWISPHGVYPQ